MVVDTTAPVIANLDSSRSVINFVNHKMVPISITASASDIIDTHPDIHIVSITSNEPENGLGDGDTDDDWNITGAMTCELRAERSGTGDGRIYTITVQFTDDFGNTTFGAVTVTVPHDSGNVASSN